MIKHFKTSTLKDYMSLAGELGMLEGKSRTDNVLAELWKQHGADTCVVYEEKLDGEVSWGVTNYNTALSEGKIVTVYTTNDVLPNDSVGNDKANNDIKIYHVETQEDFNYLMLKLEDSNAIWNDGHLPSECEYYWLDFKEETCVVVKDGEIDRFPKYNIGLIYGDTKIEKIKVPKYEVIKIEELQKYSKQIAKKREDLVNHPLHYNQYSQEVIDTIEEVTANMPVSVAYHVGNAIKYLFRAPFKGKMKQDIEKAVWYLERALTKL